jgi:hypothetical protein
MLPIRFRPPVDAPLDWNRYIDNYDDQLPTAPPYRRPRPVSEAERMAKTALKGAEKLREEP